MTPPIGQPANVQPHPTQPSPTTPRDQAATTNESTVPVRLSVEHLPNAYRIHAKVISGGLPDGEAGFADLKELGVKTVISVDGAKPDVAAARRHGLRYVHLPHGYDGIPEHRAQELAKAVRDLEGPIYIHCHHGKHRSPAAAAVACVSAGLLPAEAAEGVLVAAGTSENYRGLYAAAQQARRLESKLLDAVKADFPESAPIPPMAEAMVEMEHKHDNLKALAANDWRKLPTDPDLDPAHEALLLREHFTELLRTDDVAAKPEGFVQLIRDGEASAEALEAVLRSLVKGSDAPENRTAAATTLERVSQNCTACHRKYRDIPLDEKESP